MRVQHFSEIETEFLQRVNTMIWCNVATIDENSRPRSRILHPLWEGATGWICTHRDSFKSRHLAANPFVSLAYIANVMQPVYIDAKTEWVEDMAVKRRVWNFFKNTPEPLGFDPAHDFIRPDHENFGLLRLTSWRIDLVTFPAPSFKEGTRVWTQDIT
ncbi:MAG: pyridoxamine 5'-phosphate oxidase family protein [Chloroflexi bacterium]|nr:pyridoxamine 5'-phosphate oxidase family protein [Chloroflexota bacterium]MCC6894366.1 pyridoxamine 5'-phosphate oxidase family protein [Anaerolineae bacterium]